MEEPIAAAAGPAEAAEEPFQADEELNAADGAEQGAGGAGEQEGAGADGFSVDVQFVRPERRASAGHCARLLPLQVRLALTKSLLRSRSVGHLYPNDALVALASFGCMQSPAHQRRRFLLVSASHAVL